MSWNCEKCGKEVSDLPEGAACPFCRAAENLTVQISAIDTGNTFETVADIPDGLPTISAVESADDAYLKKGVMTPPSRPGIRGNLGRFELLKLLGRGGMGYVYLAREPMTDTQVAIKVLRQELTEHPKVTKYFMTEARHMYSMSHPNILKVLEVSESERGPFFVMPYVRGGSLRDRLSGETALNRDEILSTCIQVAEGLVYAHARGLIHRDLKPDNILIDDQQRVMITDFGLVRSYIDDSMLDVSQKTAEGTPAYMSPGVAAGQAEDTRCDIYAFGAMMYEMLTGKLPYNGPSADSILQAIRTGPPQPIHKLNPDANKYLSMIADAAMARELRDRYATIEDVLKDLERVKDGHRPIGPSGQVVRRKLPQALSILIPVILILMLLVYIFAHLKNEEEMLPAATPTPVPPTPTAVPVTADEAYQQGIEFLADENYPAAEEALAQSVTLDPGQYDAWMKLGDSYLAQEKTLSARVSYDRVLRLKGNNIEALLGIAKALKMENKPRDYTLVLTRAFRADPSNEEVVVELLTQLVNVGHAQPARGTLEVWKTTDPENPKLADWEVIVKELENRPQAPAPAAPPPQPQPR